MWYLAYSDGTISEVYENEIQERLATTSGVMAIFRIHSEALAYVGAE